MVYNKIGARVTCEGAFPIHPKMVEKDMSFNWELKDILNRFFTFCVKIFRIFDRIYF